MGSVFRTARGSDLEALLGLVEALGAPVARETLARRLALLLAMPAHAVLVAEVDGEVLGCVHVQEFHALASEPAALVVALVVAGRARRRGLGRGLLAEAEAWGRARGLASLRVRTRAERGDAQVFYRARGYEVRKHQVQFEKPLGTGPAVPG